MWPVPYGYEPTPKEEMTMLKEQADTLKKQLEDVQNRISTLEKAQAQE
jgi:predicted  nucleic acid-binding Zn-ribbon protein